MKQLASQRQKDLKRLVLIVDDEEINRQLLGFILDRDYDVIYAANGKEAYDRIRENERRLSLILLDLLMPEMDGFTLLDILHKDPTLRRIPVIVLTSEKSSEVQCLQLGAVDFIPKPYDLPDVILARIGRSIELAEDNVIINATETDNLTGLYNKDYFFEYGNRHNLYHPDMEMDAFSLNVNRLHVTNGLHGREYGNRVLRSIGECIRKRAERFEGIACRCDGDRFLLYCTHQPDCAAFVGDLIAEIQNDPANARVTVRIGVYQNVDCSLGIEESFDRATLACNTLQGSYVSSYALYDSKMHESELYAEKLIDEMDTALEQKQFRVFYQPKYSILGNRPVLSSAEALVRWFHPEFGMVSPGVFIPLFEKNGLILKLDRYVWREAAAQIRRWKDQYGFTLPVSVNISRVDMYEPGLADELLGIVRENGLEPRDLLLEITESAYTGNSQHIIDVVTRMRNDGFRVEMDDFGSGYSSLNMLATLPIDALKLDMRFIRNICVSEKDLRMVRLVIEIADFMDIPTIAEGVETENQLRLLQDAGCDLVQGYYFSRPLPADEFAKKILEREYKKKA